jgi:hypothetical protein
LTRDLFCRRIWCDADPDEVSTVQPNDNEGIEQIEANGRNNEQVHGGDIWGVITQEGTPSLAWRSTTLDHILGHRRLSDLKAELEQFAVDARCAPKRVLDAHPPDQRPQVRVDLRRPPGDRDFQRQYRRKPARCQRTMVSDG